MRYSYDEDEDSLSIVLDPSATPVRSKELDPRRLIKSAEDGEPVGIELVNVSHGINLKNLPAPKAVKQVLEKLSLPYLRREID